jgi:nucleoside-triphosphatase THEP1
LVQADPGLSHQTLLQRIGNALQSSNLKVAQQLAHELRDEGLAVWNDLAHVHTHPHDATPRSSSNMPQASSLPMSVRVHRASNGQHIVDYRA